MWWDGLGVGGLGVVRKELEIEELVVVGEGIWGRASVRT